MHSYKFAVTEAKHVITRSGIFPKRAPIWQILFKWEKKRHQFNGNKFVPLWLWNVVLCHVVLMNSLCINIMRVFVSFRPSFQMGIWPLLNKDQRAPHRNRLLCYSLLYSCLNQHERMRHKRHEKAIYYYKYYINWAEHCSQSTAKLLLRLCFDLIIFHFLFLLYFIFS